MSSVVYLNGRMRTATERQSTEVEGSQRLRIADLPLSIPTHEASADEARVARLGCGLGLDLATEGGRYVLCDERYTAIYFRGTLNEVESWLVELRDRELRNSWDGCVRETPGEIPF